MRLLIFSILIFNQIQSLAQINVSNEIHPFQVLFVDSATYLDKPREVEQFDFINKYDLIDNKGRLVLVHYSGLILEFESGTLSLREISNKHVLRRYCKRPILSDPSNYEDRSTNRGQHLAKESVSHLCIASYFEAYLSFPFQKEANGMTLSEDVKELAFEFETLTRGREFSIYVKNIFDETIEVIDVKDPLIIVSVPPNLEDNTLLFQVESKGEYTLPYAVKFDDKLEKSKYDYLLEAFDHYWNGNIKLAQYLSGIAVSKSGNDDRFIEVNQLFLN